MAIFSHMDCYKGVLETISDPDDPQEDLVVRVHLYGRWKVNGVRLDRKAAERLRDALNNWLGEEI